MDKDIDVVVKKSGNEYLVFHVGTGLSSRSADLQVAFNNLSEKIKDFKSDLSRLGADDVANLALSTSLGTPRNPRRTLLYLFAVFFFFITLAFSAGFATKAIVEKKLKTFERSFRAQITNPAPEVSEARMRDLKSTLKLIEPYLIEIKKFWSQLPEK